MSYGRCSDCGSEDYDPEWNRRSDICLTCYELGAETLKARESGKITNEDFIKLQKTIANSHGSGRGKKAMEKILSTIQESD